MNLKVTRRGEVVSPSMDEMEPVIYRLVRAPRPMPSSGFPRGVKLPDIPIVATGALLFEDKDTIKSIFKAEAEAVHEDIDVMVNLSSWVQYECMSQIHKLYTCFEQDLPLVQEALHESWEPVICMTPDRFKEAVSDANRSSRLGWIESPDRMGS